MWPNPNFQADLVTFAEKMLIEKLHVLHSDSFTTIHYKLSYYYSKFPH